MSPAVTIKRLATVDADFKQKLDGSGGADTLDLTTAAAIDTPELPILP